MPRPFIIGDHADRDIARTIATWDHPLPWLEVGNWNQRIAGSGSNSNVGTAASQILRSDSAHALELVGDRSGADSTRRA